MFIVNEVISTNLLPYKIVDSKQRTNHKIFLYGRITEN